MKEHGIDGDAGDIEAGTGAEDGEDDEEGDVDHDDVEPYNHDIDEDNGGVELEGGPVGDQTTPPNADKLASQMTILDIRDNDPLPDLNDIKPPPPTERHMTTKEAKKKAGWIL